MDRMTLCLLSFDEDLLVQANGPVSSATYMLLYLSHPEGYYMDPADAVIGVRDELITGPEISQAFGEARDPSIGSGNGDNEQLVELMGSYGTWNRPQYLSTRCRTQLAYTRRNITDLVTIAPLALSPSTPTLCSQAPPSVLYSKRI